MRKMIWVIVEPNTKPGVSYNAFLSKELADKFLEASRPGISLGDREVVAVYLCETWGEVEILT